MKKTLLICSTALLLFSLTACGNDKKSEKTSSVKTEKKQANKNKEKKATKNNDSTKSNNEKTTETNNTQSSSNDDNSKKTPSNADNTNETSKNNSSNTQTNSDETATNDGQSDSKKPYNIDDPSPEAQKATKDGIAAADAVRASNPQEYDAEIARVDAGTSDVAHEPMLGQAEQAYRSHIDPE